MNPDPDLLIAGAGPAGIAAALAGARRGLRTLLIDPAEEPGGEILAALHTELCGLYTEKSPHDAADTLNAGIQREIAAGLHRLNPDRSNPIRRGRAVLLPFDPDAFRRLVADLLDAESNLTTRLGVSVTGVTADAGRIDSVRLSTGESIRAECVVDCTGNAAVARFAGLPLQDDAERASQLLGYGVQIDEIRGDMSMLRLAIPLALRKATEAGALPSHAAFTTFSAGPQSGEGIVRLVMPPEVAARTDTVKRFATAVFEQLRQRLPQHFREAKISRTSPAPQERVGTRLKGEYTLTEEDVLSARKIDGDIPAVRNAWPMEIWRPENGPEYHFLPEGDWYEIPATCLTSPDLRNFACAGRCISAAARAAASTRVAGTCFALGELAIKALVV